MKKTGKTKEKSMKIFFRNIEANEEFNKRSNETYKRSVNVNTALSSDDRRKYRLGLKSPLTTRSLIAIPNYAPENITEKIPFSGKMKKITFKLNFYNLC